MKQESSKMILRHDNNALFLQFPGLAGFPNITHGIFTRTGGVSKDPFRSLNVSCGVGDAKRHVRQNRDIIAACMAGKDMICLSQVHGTRVTVLTGRKTPDPEADAVITDIPGKLLLVKAADCQAVLLYDPVKNVVANVHSGWRGSIGNIIGRTVIKMKSRFGSVPKDIIAGIGPSLGPCCAEFIHYKKEIPETFWGYRKGKNHFDFWAVSRGQLIEAGVLKTNIQNSNICTRCNTGLFFSYRGEGLTGRFGAVIGLKRV